jgi:NAD(P)-dependent dehydrogenase (short-subunit alcohol dehydrogenase family)
VSTNRHLEDRVVVITGAGRGIGREYALLAAAEGARVVVNDFGTGLDGDADGSSPAEGVVAEIEAAGGQAVAHQGNVASWDDAEALINLAVTTFGGLDVVINNAGILRDRMLVNMSEAEWDSIMAVHLRGHFCVTRHAAAYWRDQAKASGGAVNAALICTSSHSGLLGAVGQVNYATAKSALAQFAMLCHRELSRYGVRSYAIAPGARTRLTMSTPHAKESVGKAVEPGTFDISDPANVAPFVTWLGSVGCDLPGGSVFGVFGDKVEVFRPWEKIGTVSNGHRWTFDELDERQGEIADLVPVAAKTLREEQRQAAAAT